MVSYLLVLSMVTAQETLLRHHLVSVSDSDLLQDRLSSETNPFANNG